MVLAIMLLMPMLGGMVMTPQADVNDVGLAPVKDFGLSANPTVTNVPIVTNPDSTDNLYGGNYRTYYITANITNAVSIQDVGAITITFNSTTAIVCGVSYSNVTALWTEHATNPTYITATATNTTDANDMNITVSVTIDWLFPDTDDMWVHIAIYNATGAGITRAQSAATYDIDTDLTVSSTTFFTNAAEADGSLMAVNTLTYSYEDSAAAIFPLAAQTDFWVTRNAATTGTPVYAAESWEANAYVDATGVATWLQILSKGGGEHVETFTLLAVKQAAGSGGTTLMGTTQTDTISIEYSGVRTDTGGAGVIPVPDIPIEQGLIIGGAVVAIGGIGYIIMSRGGSRSSGRRRTSKKRKAKRKPKKKAVKRKRKR